MKKMIAMLLSMLLLFSAACAETVFESAAGYTVSYPQDRIAPDPDDGLDFFLPVSEADSDAYMIIVPTEIPYATEADAKLMEAYGGFNDQDGVVIGDAKDFAVASGLSAQTLDVTLNGVVYRYFVVEAPMGMLCVTVVFPQSAADTYGAAFTDMAASIAF